MKYQKEKCHNLDLKLWNHLNNLRSGKRQEKLEFLYRKLYQYCLKKRNTVFLCNPKDAQGRFHFQENIQFCRIARGSLTETLDQMIIANDEGYISAGDLNDFRELYRSCLKPLNGYIAYLKKAKSGQDDK